MLIQKLLPDRSKSGLISELPLEKLASPKVQGLLKHIGVGDDRASGFLQGLLGNGPFPSELAGNETLRDKILERLRGNKKNLPVSPEQAREALELLRSGELFRDVAFTLSTLLRFVANPSQFSHPATQVLRWVIGIAPALEKDLGPELKEQIENWVSDVRAGQEPADPELLNQTLKQIYSLEAVGNAIEAANMFFNKDNETLRLALIIYLRIKGINVEEQDIDVIRDTLLDRSQPDLGSFLSYVFENKKRLLGVPE